MKGYMGQVLDIDLSSKKTKTHILPCAVARQYLGGSGIAAKYLTEMMNADTDPNSADSCLVFACGSLNGSGALLAGRFAVGGKSPLTNRLALANSGGIFGTMMRFAGYDAVIIRGNADQPVYIYIEDEKCQIRSADYLWGKSVPETFKIIDKKINPEHSAAVIGPGGEQQRLSACIINDDHRAAARGGLGAVMGAKNLKALVVSGKNRVEVADRDKIVSLGSQIIGWQANEHDTEAINKFFVAGPGQKKELPSTLAIPDRFLFDQACSACPLNCGSGTLSEGKSGAPKKSAIKPGIVAAFGSKLGHNDKSIIRQCNQFCDEYGLDAMMVAGAIAWVMQCYQQGVLDKEDLDGIELLPGNSEAILKMTEIICRGQGIGAILVNGADYASQYLHKGEQLLPIYNKDRTEQCLNQAKENNHQEKSADALAKELSDYCGFCTFSDYSLDISDQLAYINAATGWDISEEQFVGTVLRVQALVDQFSE